LVGSEQSPHSARYGPEPAASSVSKSGNHGPCTCPNLGIEANLLNAEQSIRIAVAFARAAAQKDPTLGLCSACAEVLVVSGAGITVMGGEAVGPLCVSSKRVAALEDLQFTMGVGPCQDAFRSGRPVHAPNFDTSTTVRWPLFVVQARESGIGSVFAYPLSAKGSKIGVMTLYQDGEGDLGTTQHDDSIAVAQVLTETILSLQDVAPNGVLAADLDGAAAYRAQVHQASGMVSIQLEIPVAEALVRIRAHSFATGRPTGLVAADIVARRLRLFDDRQQPGEDDRQ
jgi:hypothetical protein